MATLLITIPVIILVALTTDCRALRTIYNEPCKFPFTHQGVEYNEKCAQDADGKEWCYTDTGTKEYCARLPLTESGLKCVFPAVFEGVNYTDSCFRKSDNYLYCYTSKGSTKAVYCEEDAQDRLLNPAISMFSNLEQTTHNLKNIYDYVVIDITADKNSLVVKGGTVSPICDKNLRDYKSCNQLDMSKETRKPSEKVVRVKCEGPLYHVVIFANVKSPQINIIEQKLTNFYQSQGRIKHILQKHQDLLQIKDIVPHFIIPPMTGNFITPGVKASPIALDNDGLAPIVIGRIGLGKIAFVGHIRYFEPINYTNLINMPLFRGLERWLGGDNIKVEEVVPGGNAIKEQTFDKSSFGRVMVWNSHNLIGKEGAENLLKLVNNGGGLLIGMDPWTYKNKISKFEESELWPLLTSSGILPTASSYCMEGTVNVATKAILNEQSTETEIYLLADSLRYFNKFKKYQLFTTYISSLPAGLEGTPFHTNIGTYLKDALERYKPLVESIFPCTAIVAKGKSRNLMLHYNKLMALQVLRDTGFKAPAVSVYPGDFLEPQPKTVSSEMTVKCQKLDDTVPLGLYLPAGGVAELKIVDGRDNYWRVVLNLNLKDISGNTEYYKWPLIHTETDWGVTRKLYSALGGTLWLKCYEPDTIRVKVSGVVKAPRWDLRDPTSQVAWAAKVRDSPGLWGTVAGDSVYFVLPRSALMNVEDPRVPILHYDQAFKHELHLAGAVVGKRPREIIAPDIQVGPYMHNGYPIRGSFYLAAYWYDAGFLLNADYINKKGCWHVYHELGHNMHDINGGYWVLYNGSSQIAANVFSFRAIQVMLQVPIFDSPKTDYYDIKDIKAYLEAKPSPSQWVQSHSVGIIIYLQLQKAFGWEYFRTIFRIYASMSESDKSELTFDVFIVSKWVELTAEITGYNVVPLYDFWGLETSEACKKKVASLPKFLPDDFVTQAVPTRTQMILDRYVGTKRSGKLVAVNIGPLLNWEEIKGPIQLTENS